MDDSRGVVLMAVKIRQTSHLHMHICSIRLCRWVKVLFEYVCPSGFYSLHDEVLAAERVCIWLQHGAVCDRLLS